MIWGLHNYIDANRFRTRGTRALLRAVKGDVWFTETGGLVVRRNGSTVEFPRLDAPRREGDELRVPAGRALPARQARVLLPLVTGADAARHLGLGARRPPRPAPPAYEVLLNGCDKHERSHCWSRSRCSPRRLRRRVQGRDLRRRQGDRPHGHGLLADVGPGRTRTATSSTREKLALSDAGGRAGALAVNFASLELVGADDDALQAQAVRRAIADPQIIAAIVDATPVTVPLFNAAGHPAGRAPAATRAWPPTRRRCPRASARSATLADRRRRRPTSGAASQAAFGRDPAPARRATAIARWRAS